MNRDLHLLTLCKGSERYVFMFDDASRAELLRTFSLYAARQDLTFTWYDAATCAQKLRQDDDYKTC